MMTVNLDADAIKQLQAICGPRWNSVQRILHCYADSSPAESAPAEEKPKPKRKPRKSAKAEGADA